MSEFKQVWDAFIGAFQESFISNFGNVQSYTPKVINGVLDLSDIEDLEVEYAEPRKSRGKKRRR